MVPMKNRVQLIGNLGADPEVKDLGKGNKMARMNIAINTMYRNKKGDYVEDTQWHRVVAFGKTADRVEKVLKKGIQVVVEGRLSNNHWEDKDGNKHYDLDVIADDFVPMLAKRKAEAEA